MENLDFYKFYFLSKCDRYNKPISIIYDVIDRFLDGDNFHFMRTADSVMFAPKFDPASREELWKGDKVGPQVPLITLFPCHCDEIVFFIANVDRPQWSFRL